MALRRFPALVLGLAAIALTLSACASGPPPAPCAPRAPGASASARIFEGESDLGDNDQGRRSAVAKALAEAASELGVRVTSTAVEEMLRTNDSESERIHIRTETEAVPVEVRRFKSGTCYDSAAKVTRAAIAIPASEWARIERQRRGRTLLVVDCRAADEGACDADLRDALREVGTSGGLEISSTISAPEGLDYGDSDAMVTLGAERGAAFVLWVRVRVEHRATERNVMYAYSTMSANLVETSDGKVGRSVKLDPVKGAHLQTIGSVRYGPVAAMRKANEKALEELGDDISLWR